MTRRYRWARRAVWGLLAVVGTIGCNPLTTIAFLTHKDVKVPAEAPLTFKDGPKKDKEEVVVALFISQGTGQSYEFAGAETVLYSDIARVLPEMAKENKQKITVVPLRDVNKFKMKHPQWHLMNPATRGKHLGADFVLDIYVKNMSLYQPGSLNQIYEGHAEVEVQTYDVDAGPEPKHYYIHPYAYPKTPRDASAIPASMFRKQFLENLAVELCRHHVDYKPGIGIADGR
jgi:hypothetical protein